MPTPQRLYKLIPYLRGSIILLTLACFATLFSYPKPPPPTSDNSSAPDQDSFNILQQLALNATLLFSYSFALYSNNSPNHRPLSPIYRMSLICTAFVLSWVYGMGPLVRIFGNSGCGSEAYQDVRGRCVMQLSVSSMEVVWTILMFVEGLVTDKRNRDKFYREEMGWSIREDDHVLASRARAQAAAAEANGVVEYQPDLSLEGAGGGPVGGRRRRVVGVEDGDNDEMDEGEVEMEQLPPYMPKARSDQAVIIDLTNVRPPRQQQTEDADPSSSSHQTEGQGQEDTRGQQQEHQQRDQTASSGSGGVLISSSSSSSTIVTPQLSQLSLQQQQQQQQEQLNQHPEPIHPHGGPGTGLPRVPSYSE